MLARNQDVPLQLAVVENYNVSTYREFLNAYTNVPEAWAGRMRVPEGQWRPNKAFRFGIHISGPQAAMSVAFGQVVNDPLIE